MLIFVQASGHCVNLPLLGVHTWWHDMQEAFYGKEITIADREMVESRIELVLDGADKEDVAFLVVGDPFGCAAAPLPP